MMTDRPWISDEGVRRLREIERLIVNEPELYDQSRWMARREHCGTVCCIAGHAVARYGQLPSNEWMWDPSYWVDKGQVALGITEREAASRLFRGATRWPHPFSEAYVNASTEKDRACVAVRRIEHFIRTGE